VKLNNILIFFGVVLVISGTMIWTYRHGGVIPTPPEALRQLKPRPDLSFSEIIISEITGPVRHWEIKAQKAVIEKKQGELYNLSGTIYSKNRKTLSFHSPRALTDLDRSNFIIYTVTANTYQPTADPWHLTTRTLSWNSRQEILEGKEKVNIWNSRSVLYSDLLTGILSLNTFTMRSNVHALFKLAKTDIASPTPDIILTCGSLFYDGDRAQVQASGNAQAVHKNMIIVGDQFIYDMRNTDILLKNKVQVTYQKEDGQPTMVITAENASCNVISGEAYFRGKTQLKAEDIRADATEMRYYGNERLVECLGNVRAFKDDQKFTGKKVLIYMDTRKIVTEGRSKFTAPK
jgi:lipopolysaccharide assembly outer membrane protein LptD (OstA)